MDPLPLLRQALLFAHTLAFAVAMGAVLREDRALLSARKGALPRLRAVARRLTCALAALWASGLALVATDIGIDAGAVAGAVAGALLLVRPRMAQVAPGIQR